MLKEPSKEQFKAINSIKKFNVIIDAVAGSGKTTTVLHIGKKYKDQNILLLTYNSRLKIESREKVADLKIKNMEVHSYHAFCTKYYDNRCYTDKGILRVLNKNFKMRRKVNYDIIIIDEAQDMTHTYYHLVYKIIGEMEKPPKLCIIGDQKQSIFQFNNADNRYIRYAEQIFNFNKLPWKRISLTTSFRITHAMANFINKCVLNEKKLQAAKSGSLVNYLICDAFGDIERSIYKKVLTYLEKSDPEEIFILAPSTKSRNSPVRRLANRLTNQNIPIYVSNNSEKLEKDVIRGKIVFTTYHQAKGLERDFVVVYNFDNSYFKYYKIDADSRKCTNEIYVAITRAKKELTVIHHYQNLPFKFVNFSNINKITNMRQHVKMRKKKDINKIKIIGATQLTDYLPQNIITEAKSYIKITKVQPQSNVINIDITTEQDDLYENVSEITGTAIPAHYEFLTTNNMTICSKLLEHNIKIDPPTKDNIEQLLKISNYYCSHVSGYNYKKSQIKYYDWLNHEQLNKCVERIKKLNLSNKVNYEKSYEYIENKVLKQNMKILKGSVDCIDQINDNTYNVWEFKCVKELKDEHFIQLAIYAFLTRYYKINDEIKFTHQNSKLEGIIKSIFKNGNINIKVDNNIFKIKEEDIIKPNFNYYLFNILTDEIYQIEIKYEDSKKMVDYIISQRFNPNLQLTDREFMDRIKKIKQKNTKTEKIDELTKIPKIIGKNIMVLDIETDGLSACCNIVEIAYQIYNPKKELVWEKDLLINNGNCETDYFKKISPQKILKDGLDPIKALNILLDDMVQCKYIVCHNAVFDISRLRGYYDMYDIKYIIPKVICTKEASKNEVNLKTKNGRIKTPKLLELYQHLFNKSMDNNLAHRGNYDVEITAKCFFELINREVIVLKSNNENITEF